MYYIYVSLGFEYGSHPPVTDEDIANQTVTIYRKFEDSVYQSTMMPSRYYFENEYLQNKVKYIQDLLLETSLNGDSFMFITDEHWQVNAKNSPMLANYIKETTGISKIFSGGDRDSDGYNSTVPNLFRRALGNDNYFPAAGNHDFGMDYGDAKRIYAGSFIHLADNPNVHWGDAGNLYYYVNNSVQKIRYIVLQAFEPNSTKEGLNVTIKYDDKQLEWLKNEALEVDDGWTVFIFSHVVVYGNDYTKKFSVPTELPGYEELYNIIADYDGRGEIAGVLQGHGMRQCISTSVTE